jgi:glucose/arabinose dehydrogenase
MSQRQALHHHVQGASNGMRRKSAGVSVALVALYLFAGCGSDDPSDESAARADSGADAGKSRPRDGGDGEMPRDRTRDAGMSTGEGKGERDAAASAGRSGSGEEPASGSGGAPARDDEPTRPGPDAIPDAGMQAPQPGTDDDASVDDDAGVITCDPPELQGLALQPLVSGQGLATLSAAAQPPGSTDWYLVEQRGRIVILRDGALLPVPFLDVQAEIEIGQGYEDRGLISVAFAPDYAASGRVYVVLTPVLGADANRDLVLEYQRSAADPDVLDVASRKKIVEILGSVSSNPLRNIHNGGRAAFGPDGFLYVAMGDGGGVSCNDVEPDEPQDISSPFGKILRLDPTRDAPYAARGNPFARGGDPRVYHFGLRNPYNFSFDRLTGDLYIGDVGQNSYEEVDVAPSGMAGLNFGWAAFEGVTVTCPQRALRTASTHTQPIFVADRRRTGCSGPFCDFRAVVGGVVYRGPSLPQLDGVYLFGDYAGRRMVGIRRCSGVSSELRTIRKQCDVGFPDEACFGALAGTPAFSGLTGIYEGNDGEIYMVANRDSFLKVVAQP